MHVQPRNSLTIRTVETSAQYSMTLSIFSMLANSVLCNKMSNILLLHDTEQSINHIRASIKTKLLRYVLFSYTVVFSEATVYMYNKNFDH